MTSNVSDALAYFDQAAKRKRVDPEIKAALEIFDALFRKWNAQGFDRSFDDANYAAVTWFRAWDRGGRKGGVAGFRQGLHRSFRWACVKKVPRSSKIVQGIDAAGNPTFLCGRGGMPLMRLDEVVPIVARWNAEAKVSGSRYRFNRFHCKQRCGDGWYKIQRYELSFEFPGLAGAVALDALPASYLGEFEGDVVSKFKSNTWEAWEEHALH